MKSWSRSLIAIWFLAAFMAGTCAAQEQPPPFMLSCDKVESVQVDLIHEPGTAWPTDHHVIGCQLTLTPEAGEELENLGLRYRRDKYVPVMAGSTAVCRHDANVRSIPPVVTFTGETWDEVRTKLMAICPDKIPEDVPQDVLDHRPE